MFNNIIVGVDGEDGGRDAIALARRLRAADGRLTLCHAYLGDVYPWRGSSPAYDSAEREAAQALLTRAREEAGIEAEIHPVGAPSTGRALHDLAESVGADLIVVGSSRHSLMGRVLVGDRTRAALNGSPCAVAIAPAGFASHEGAIVTIGVGYDGSAESEHAVAIGRRLAAELGGRLEAMEVVLVPGRTYVGPAWPDRQMIQGLLDQARHRVESLGDVEAHAVWGRPAEELAIWSSSLDLLVIGSRSYGPMGRLVHGSTAHHLTGLARSPLLIVTRGTREHEAAQAAQAAQAALASERPGAGVS